MTVLAEFPTFVSYPIQCLTPLFAEPIQVVARPSTKKAANPSQPLQYPSIRQAPRLLSRCVGAPFLHHEFTNSRRCAFSLGDCRCPAQRKSGSFLMKNALDATVGNQPEERNEDIEELRNPRQPERYADA